MHSSRSVRNKSGKVLVGLQRNAKAARRRNYSWRLGSIGIFIFLSYFAYLWVVQSIQFHRLAEEHGQIQAQLTKLAEKASELETEKERKLSLSHVEERARKDLGLMRPGEIPFWRVEN